MNGIRPAEGSGANPQKKGKKLSRQERRAAERADERAAKFHKEKTSNGTDHNDGKYVEMNRRDFGKWLLGAAGAGLGVAYLSSSGEFEIEFSAKELETLADLEKKLDTTRIPKTLTANPRINRQEFDKKISDITKSIYGAELEYSSPDLDKKSKLIILVPDHHRNFSVPLDQTPKSHVQADATNAHLIYAISKQFPTDYFLLEGGRTAVNVNAADRGKSVTQCIKEGASESYAADAALNDSLDAYPLDKRSIMIKTLAHMVLLESALSMSNPNDSNFTYVLDNLWKSVYSKQNPDRDTAIKYYEMYLEKFAKHFGIKTLTIKTNVEDGLEIKILDFRNKRLEKKLIEAIKAKYFAIDEERELGAVDIAEKLTNQDSYSLLLFGYEHIPEIQKKLEAKGIGVIRFKTFDKDAVLKNK